VDRESLKYIWRGRKVWRGSVDKEVEVRARRVGGERRKSEVHLE